jgi:hypothetical protein
MSKVAIVGTKDSLTPGAIVEHELATVCARGFACSVRHTRALLMSGACSLVIFG